MTELQDFGVGKTTEGRNGSTVSPSRYAFHGLRNGHHGGGRYGDAGRDACGTGVAYTRPWSIIASATLMKPAMLAPLT